MRKGAINETGSGEKRQHTKKNAEARLGGKGAKNGRTPAKNLNRKSVPKPKNKRAGVRYIKASLTRCTKHTVYQLRNIHEGEVRHS